MASRSILKTIKFKYISKTTITILKENQNNTKLYCYNHVCRSMVQIYTSGNSTENETN